MSLLSRAVKSSCWKELLTTFESRTVARKRSRAKESKYYFVLNLNVCDVVIVVDFESISSFIEANTIVLILMLNALMILCYQE